jgi:hypothetical protein
MPFYLLIIINVSNLIKLFYKKIELGYRLLDNIISNIINRLAAITLKALP